MNKFMILFALVATVVAEPPSSYGAPQRYSAPSYSAPVSSGYESYDDGGSYVDDALLARVAQLLEQSESSYSGGYSAQSSAYGAPSSGYGAPQRSSGGVYLGQPMRAQQIAEFDLTEQRSQGYSGGYSGGHSSSGGYN